MLKVAKFGGSSVAGAAQFKNVKSIVEADPDRQIIVVSAAGKRNSEDHKITDLLYLCNAHRTYGVSCEDILSQIENRFLEIRNDLGLSYDVEAAFGALRQKLDRGMSVDELVSRGEYFTAQLMAEYLGRPFVDAADCVFFGMDGQLDKEKTYAAIEAAFRGKGPFVLPGFYGRIPTGRPKLMPRGGGDITGALAAAAVNADVYENWTDVSGILMADPRIVKDPKPIAEMTYGELRELAFMGASVLQEDSILPVREKGIALNIRNSGAPDDPGTVIREHIEAGEEEERFITGIAGRKGFMVLTVMKRGMEQGTELCQALAILSQYGVKAEHITLGLDSFAFVISQAALGDAVFDLIADIKKTCSPDGVDLKDGLALVASVGRKMTFRPGVSGRLFKAIGEAGVNIRTIAQGADELAIVIGVEEEDYETAIRVMYEGFAG